MQTEISGEAAVMFHWMKLRAFVYATEDHDRVMQALDNISEGDTAVNHAQGAYGDSIEIIERTVKKERMIKALFSRLSKPDIRRIADETDERTDERSVFHLRLDKQRACEGELVPGSGGDVVDIEVKIASYPASRDSAVAMMKGYLEAML